MIAISVGSSKAECEATAAPWSRDEPGHPRTACTHWPKWSRRSNRKDHYAAEGREHYVMTEPTSDTALAVYSTAREGQRVLNEARKIRTKINDARGSRHDAGARWPFELLQNALDAGPRTGRGHVEVRLRRSGGAFTFEHDGAAFSIAELAALLSGGSSKDFESEQTTGRFVTDALHPPWRSSPMRLKTGHEEAVHGRAA